MNKLVEQTVTNYFRRLSEGFEFNAEGSDDGMAEFAAELADLYQMVDLDLPSGILWAKWNLGADRTNPAGDYYQWAATCPDGSGEYVFEKSPYNDGYGGYMECNYTKYSKEDGNIQLDPDDDAASRINSDWRTPTPDEVQELIRNTKHVWTPDYHGMGPGCILKAKTGESEIFMPAGGCVTDGTALDRNQYADAWTSGKTKSDEPRAVYFTMSKFLMRAKCLAPRYYGMPIRPVMDNPEKK